MHPAPAAYTAHATPGSDPAPRPVTENHSDPADLLEAAS
jgi:hypothetical protein